MDHSVSIPPVAAASPISLDQQAQMLEARKRFKVIRRMSRNATWGSFTSGFIGVTSFALSVGQPSGELISAAMVAAAIVQFVGSRRLLQLRANALRVLAWNQFVLGFLFVLYGAWCLTTIKATNPQMRQLLRQVAGSGSGMLLRETRMMLAVTYWILILFGVFAQGGAGVYYLWRQRTIARYQAQTPAWIIDLQRKNLAG